MVPLLKHQLAQPAMSAFGQLPRFRSRRVGNALVCSRDPGVIDPVFYASSMSSDFSEIFLCFDLFSVFYLPTQNFPNFYLDWTSYQLKPSRLMDPVFNSVLSSVFTQFYSTFTRSFNSVVLSFFPARPDPNFFFVQPRPVQLLYLIFSFYQFKCFDCHPTLLSSSVIIMIFNFLPTL